MLDAAIEVQRKQGGPLRLESLNKEALFDELGCPNIPELSQVHIPDF